MHRTALRLLQVCTILSLSSGTLGLAVANSAQPELKKAYAQTKSASTIEDYTEVIRLCAEAQTQTLSERNSDYAKELASWAFNRRGEARTGLAAAALKKGDDKQAAELDAQALSDFEAAVERDPTRWKALHNRGVSYAVAHKYEKAIADFSRVIELQAGYGNAWFNRAEIHYELGKLTEAIRDYSSAIRVNPRDAGAYTSRGHAYFRRRRFRESLTDYDRAVRLEPANAESYTNRGDAYQSLGIWERAASDFRRATELDSQSARAYQSAAWLMATCPDRRYRNAELAVQAANRAVALLDQTDHRYLDTLAAAQANAGQFDEATATLTEAIAAAPPKEQQGLKKRLVMYNSQQPYRQDRSSTASRTER